MAVCAPSTWPRAHSGKSMALKASMASEYTARMYSCTFLKSL